MRFLLDTFRDSQPRGGVARLDDASSARKLPDWAGELSASGTDDFGSADSGSGFTEEVRRTPESAGMAATDPAVVSEPSREFTRTLHNASEHTEGDVTDPAVVAEPSDGFTRILHNAPEHTEGDVTDPAVVAEPSDGFTRILHNAPERTEVDATDPTVVAEPSDGFTRTLHNAPERTEGDATDPTVVAEPENRSHEGTDPPSSGFAVPETEEFIKDRPAATAIPSAMPGFEPEADNIVAGSVPASASTFQSQPEVVAELQGRASDSVKIPPFFGELQLSDAEPIPHEYTGRTGQESVAPPGPMDKGEETDPGDSEVAPEVAGRLSEKVREEALLRPGYADPRPTDLSGRVASVQTGGVGREGQRFSKEHIRSAVESGSRESHGEAAGKPLHPQSPADEGFPGTETLPVSARLRSPAPALTRSGAEFRHGVPPAGVRRSPEEGPTVHIGQVDIVVQAEERARSRPRVTAPAENRASRLYLRNL